MNKITSDELNCLVTHEDPPEASQPLGHLLSHIFKPFKIPLPDVSELKIPLEKIVHPNERVRSQYHSLSPDSLVPLYNTATSTWNWNLPVDPPGDADSDLENADSTSGAPQNGETSGYPNVSGTIQQSPSRSTFRHPRSQDIRAYRPMKNMPARHSSSADPAASTSESLDQVPTPGSLLLDDDLESIASDSSGSEESLIEDSLERSSNDSTTQSFAHEESAPPPFQCNPLCKIRVGDTMYIIKRILFVTQGLVGRGTTCYLVSLDEEDYIVKDHWVLGKQDAVILNEIKMLDSMCGVPGVPDLVDHWLVTTSDGEVDNTQNYRKKERKSTRGTNRAHVRLVFKPCARPLHMFRTLKELVRALRDIVIIQKTAVEERKILHRDCSLNNAMILDDIDISKEFLIDWEFAVRITADNQYPIGGTGTVPFMSRKLLSQVACIQEQAMAKAQEKQ
ncbi:hypothetical protein F4604DRAFT_1684499 [Suillus subluteus]|nr:hypothetical protein F4604DRAFT_1684499 [Suillus subluteus]